MTAHNGPLAGGGGNSRERALHLDLHLDNSVLKRLELCFLLGLAWSHRPERHFSREKSSFSIEEWLHFFIFYGRMAS